MSETDPYADIPVVLNPEAIGNPGMTPIVQCPPALVRMLNPCAGDAPSQDGYCGGVNGWHADDCPKARS